MNHKKKQGQYMTPDGIVSIILNSIGFTGKHVLSRTIIEPSFGDGAFLINIVQRIFSEGTQAGLSSDEIIHIIKNNVFGIEKDKELYSKAISRLNTLLDTYHISNFDWTNNLLCGDTLIEYKKFEGKIDYVVGNPPYVRIHHIPESYRDVIKDFKFIDGMIDLYIVFYEIGIKMLNDTGKLGFISPNSFMKNTSQKKFRNYLIDNKYISAIYDFKTSKVFAEADTYTCICILNKNKHRTDLSVDYKEYSICSEASINDNNINGSDNYNKSSMYNVAVENKFPFEYFTTKLKGTAWNLSSAEDIKFLEQNKGLPIKIQNIAIVQTGISTNKDAAYIIRVFTDKDLTIPYMGKHTDKLKTVYFTDKQGNIWSIESTILHRCVKASKFDGVMDNTYIIFPYEQMATPQFLTSNGKRIASGYQPLTESQLQHNFPQAYDYLFSLKNELIARDMDKNAAWFLFARSQGIQNSGFKKIVFKHIIDKSSITIEPYIVDEDVIVYSKIYTTIDINIVIAPNDKLNGDIQSDTYNFDEELYELLLNDVCNILKSDDFAKYCLLVGKDMSGGYVEISAKMIKQFGIILNDFPNYIINIPTYCNQA